MRGRVLMLALLAGVAAAVTFGASRTREPRKVLVERTDAEERKAGPTKAYYGIEGCRTGGPGGIGCHNQDVDAKRPPGYVCRANEIKFWLKNDKHLTAYRALITNEKDAAAYVNLDEARYSDEELKQLKDRDSGTAIVERNTRAIRMEKILAQTERGKRVAKDNGGVYRLIKDPNCLACHAQVIPRNLDDRSKTKEEAEDREKNEKRTVTASFHEEEGVNCVVCHGPYRDWVIEHTGLLTGSDKWRATKREIKEQKYGMTDVWNPVKRTKLCVSCHVGNLAEGKFLSHETYAAGHPALTGFEPAYFSESMPRHWDYFREKNPKVVAAQQLDQKQYECEQTQLLLVGAAVTLRESMRLLVRQADEVRELDLSSFDCYACHVDLKSPQWHDTPPLNARPGRASTHRWPAVLVPLTIAFVERDGAKQRTLERQFADLQKALDDALTCRPFGDPKEVRKAAAALEQWLDALATRANARACTRDDFEMLLRRLAELGRSKPHDFDSARQIARAGDVLLREYADATRDKRAFESLANLQENFDRRLSVQMAGRPKRKDLEAEIRAMRRYDLNWFVQGLRDLDGSALDK